MQNDIKLTLSSAAIEDLNLIIDTLSVDIREKISLEKAIEATLSESASMIRMVQAIQKVKARKLEK